MYKIIRGLVAMLVDHLTQPDLRTRSNHNYTYKHMLTSTSAYSNSFFPRSIPDWNKLAADIANSQTINIFKYEMWD